MKRNSLFKGEKTDDEFKEDILNTIRNIDRNMRVKFFKTTNTRVVKEYPAHTRQYFDRNKAYREIAETSVSNVRMITMVWGSPDEF